MIKYKSTPEIDKIILVDGLNMTELRTYFEPTIIIAHRNENFTDAPGQMRRSIYTMRQCEEKDFTSVGYKVSPLFRKKLKHRICPNIPDDSNYKVKNLFEDLEERISFSIQIMKCQNSNEIKCKDDISMEKLMKQLKINQQVLNG